MENETKTDYTQKSENWGYPDIIMVGPKSVSYAFCKANYGGPFIVNTKGNSGFACLAHQAGF